MPRERARTVLIDRLAATVWAKRRSRENCGRESSGRQRREGERAGSYVNLWVGVGKFPKLAFGDDR